MPIVKQGSQHLLSLGYCIALASCAVTSDYHPAPLDVPSRWSEAQGNDAATAQSLLPWWTAFHDKELDSLVQRALRSNLDIQLAQTRLREVRAQLRVTAASFSPSLNASASYARERDSTHAPAPVLLDKNNRIESTAGGSDNLFQAGFDASWELDVFGGQRRAIEAARADSEVSKYERDAVVLTLLAEVSRHYIELRGNQRQLSIAADAMAAHKELLKLIRARQTGGLTSSIEVARTESALKRFALDIGPLDIQSKNAEHRLSVLLGLWPGALHDELKTSGAIPVSNTDFSLGLPSDLMRQRPDIQRAERQLDAASARLGMANADMYPRFSLGGAAGLASVSALDFFSAGSLLWKIGPSISWPIFRRGQIAATIEVRDAQQQGAFIAYRKAILYGLEEVENASSAYSQEKIRREQLANALSSFQQSVELSRARYQGGLADFRDVIEAEIYVFQAQSELAKSDTAIALALVALHKALGGGWDAQQLAVLANSPENAACASSDINGKKTCSTSP